MKQVIDRQRYRWVIAAACALMIFVCLGFCSSSKGLYLAAITQALGIRRSLFSINDSCRYLATAGINLFFGVLCAKFGLRKLIGAGFFCLIVSMLLYAAAPDIGLFCLGGVFLGLGLAWTTTTVVGCIVHRWFPAHAGKITGLILAANGIGAALAAQIVSPIIYEAGNPFGYRNAYRLVAVILAVTAVIVLALYREPPGAPAAAQKKEPRGNAPGLRFADAKRSGAFYLTLLCVFFTGFVLQGTTGVSSAHMKDVGLPDSYVATVLSAHALSLTACKFLTGVLHDRFGLRRTLLLCDLTAVAVLLLLAGLHSQSYLPAMAYGVCSALALPLETIMLPLITEDLYGAQDFDQFLGVIVSVNTAGYAAGTPVTNWVFDRFGTYRPAFLASCGIMIAVTVCLQLLLRRAAARRTP